MSETKPEIPAPMLDAAVEAIVRGEFTPPTANLVLQTPNNATLERIKRTAQATLEAAGVAGMAAREARLLELVGSADAETAIAYLEDKFRGRDSQTAMLEARIAELEADSRRLRWLMTGSGIDGFYGVVDDRHNFAIQIAYERGHDEPTSDDEFDGWRRLIDAALNASSGAGGE